MAKFKTKKFSHETDSVPLDVAGRRWFARVRCITREHDQELMRQATTTKPDLTEVMDAVEYSRSFCHVAVVGWEGLTPEMLAMMVTLDDDSEKPELIKEGQGESEIAAVKFDAELADVLWFKARGELFQNPIYGHAKRVLETTALRKEMERKNSLGSSAI